MSRAPVATLDLSALRHNFNRLRQLAPASRLLAVIKANGYGHGLLRVAKALGEADGFAVAHLEEAISLREAGIQQPILLLQGFTDPDEIQQLLRFRVDSVIHDPEQVSLLEQTHRQGELGVWLKLDSGMHRLGIAPYQAGEIRQRLQDCDRITIRAVMSHLARADETDHPQTEQQRARFTELTEGWSLPRSLANSAAIFRGADYHFDWIRPGLALYGISPFAGESAASLGLRPVMTLRSHVLAVKPVKKGVRVGYGGAWQAAEDTRLGIVALGYADGYPRHADNHAPVWVNGERRPLAGRISMDMLCIDLGPDSQVRMGDEVTLWGEQLPVEEVARHARTIPYELVCKVTPRVHREVIDG